MLSEAPEDVKIKKENGEGPHQKGKLRIAGASRRVKERGKKRRATWFGAILERFTNLRCRDPGALGPNREKKT